MTEIIENSVAESEWCRFLKDCPGATIYHTPEWKRFLEQTFQYKPHYLFATDNSGNVVGLLPLFHVRSRLTGNRLCSVPFSHECGCLGDQEVCATLVDEAIAIRAKNTIDKIEIRNFSGHEGFRRIQYFSTHLLDLSANPEDTWKLLEKGSVRWAVKKAKNLGVTVSTSPHIDDLKKFHELNRITKQNLGVPSHPWKFFENLFSTLDGYVTLYLSYFENQIIGGGIMVRYKEHVLYGYGAADPDFRHLHPYNAFIWKSIEDACIQGYRCFDFGRTSFTDAGLIQFKKKWGTREKKLYYSLYPDSSKMSMPSRDSSLYRLANAGIRYMPMPVYSKFSDRIFSHFG